MEYTTKTIKHNGWTITIHRPILTDEERAKREKQVTDTLIANARSCGVVKSEKE
jgi:hypothetical protein